MNDKEKKFTVISNKKVIKRFAAIADSNISDSSEKIDESKKKITEEKPFILSKDNLIKEESVILEKKTTIKELAEETIAEPAVAKKINKKLNNELMRHSRLSPRAKNVLRLIKPIIDKYGLMDSDKVEQDPTKNLE